MRSEKQARPGLGDFSRRSDPGSHYRDAMDVASWSIGRREWWMKGAARLAHKLEFAIGVKSGFGTDTGPSADTSRRGRGEADGRPACTGCIDTAWTSDRRCGTGRTTRVRVFSYRDCDARKFPRRVELVSCCCIPACDTKPFPDCSATLMHRIACFNHCLSDMSVAWVANVVSSEYASGPIPP